MFVAFLRDSLARCFVLVLAVVHDPTDRRVGLVGHLHQIQVELTGERQCLGQRLDADLGTVGADESDLPGPDAVVDPGLVVVRRRSYGRSLLIYAQILLGGGAVVGTNARRPGPMRSPDPKTTKRTPEKPTSAQREPR